MITNRQLFLDYVGQTSLSPMGMEFEKAEGIYLYDKKGRKYIDLVSGVAVSNLGHGNQQIINAVITQIKSYSHLMVYGEYVQSPQVKLARLIADNLPDGLDKVYYVNSGSEAIEGALKLAKKYTGRIEIFSFRKAYHGSTHGALSIMGDEKLKTDFRPLLPDTNLLEFNCLADIEKISNKTACVVAEVIQAEAGIIVPEVNFLQKLKSKCQQTGTLLIFDEIQTGFGRTGKLFAFEHYGVVPDILTLAKAMGGGLPIGAFVSSREIMNSLCENPELGHITTFGGHPVSCASGLASLSILLEKDYISKSEEKAKLFRDQLKHKSIKSIRGKGLFLAVELYNPSILRELHHQCLKLGIIFDLFLFCDNAFRIAPPLIITKNEINMCCELLLEALDKSKI